MVIQFSNINDKLKNTTRYLKLILLLLFFFIRSKYIKNVYNFIFNIVLISNYFKNCIINDAHHQTFLDIS